MFYAWYACGSNYLQPTNCLCLQCIQSKVVLVYTAGTAMAGPLFCQKKTKMPFFAVIKDNLAHDLFKFCYIYTFSRVAIEISQILEGLTQSLKKVY